MILYQVEFTFLRVFVLPLQRISCTFPRHCIYESYWNPGALRSRCIVIVLLVPWEKTMQWWNWHEPITHTFGNIWVTFNAAIGEGLLKSFFIIFWRQHVFFFMMETICCEISCDKGCWWWKFLWTVMDRTFNNVLIIVLLLKWTKIISLFLQIIITALGQREAAGPKETGVPNNILASSVPIPHYLPPQIFTDTEKWEWAVAFFSLGSLVLPLGGHLTGRA